MTYSVGERLIGTAIMTGRPREYQVTKVNRVTVEFRLVQDGGMRVLGKVRRVKPDENGELKIMSGKLCMVRLQKKTA